VIITRDVNYSQTGCIVVHSLEDALRLARQNNEKEVFVIGGGQIYDQALNLADRIYLTKIHENFKGDTFFPDIDMTNWEIVFIEKHPSDERNLYAYDFIVFERSL